MLLCCVLLLGVFSVGVSASNNNTYQVYQYHRFPSTLGGTGLTFTPNNGTVEKKENSFIYYDYPSSSYYSVYRVSNVDTGVLINSDSKAKVRFNNVYFSLLFTDIGAPDGGNLEALNYLYITKPDSVYANVTFTDGSSLNYYDEVSVIKKDKALNITFSFTPSKDVSSIAFFAKIDNPFYGYQCATYTEYTELTMYSGEFDGDNKYQFSVEIDNGVSGFLSSIVDWIKGIFNKLVDLPSLVWGFFENMINHIYDTIVIISRNVGNLHNYIWQNFEGALDSIFTKIGSLFDSVVGGFNDVWSWFETLWLSILELPEIIWGVFEDGLKSLFVPDEAYFDDTLERYEKLMASRLGAVWQVGTLLHDTWDGVLDSVETKTVDFPKVSINLPDGNNFSFGGYSVKIVPDGFDFLVESVKIIVGIISTLLFINGLRKIYDDIMEG